MRMFSFRMVAVASCLCLCALAPPGCAGNKTVQGLDGQTAEDSPQNKGTFVDNPTGNGTGTTAFDSVGTLGAIQVSKAKIDAKTAGAAFRALVLSPDLAAIYSPADVIAKGVDIDPTNKRVHFDELSTSVSTATTALASNLEQYKGVYASWDAARQAQFHDAMDTVKTLAPGLFELIKTVVGMP